MTVLPPFIEATNLVVTADDQVTWATDRIRAYCGWHIWPSVTVSQTVSGDGGRRVLLPTLHLTAVASVVRAGETLEFDIDYEWTTAGVITLQRRCSARGVWREPLYITYTHGHDALPPELVPVAVAVAKRMPLEIASVTQEGADGITRTYGGLLAGQAALNAGWTAAEQMILDRHRVTGWL